MNRTTAEKITDVIKQVLLGILMVLTIWLLAATAIQFSKEISHTKEPAQIVSFCDRGTGADKHYYAEVITDTDRCEVEISYKNYLEYECGEIGYLLDGCFFTTVTEKECE